MSQQVPAENIHVNSSSALKILPYIMWKRKRESRRFYYSWTIFKILLFIVIGYFFIQVPILGFILLVIYAYSFNPITNHLTKDNPYIKLDKMTELPVNEEDPYGFYNRGLANFKLVEFEKALEDLNKAIQLDNSEPRFFAVKAFLLAKMEEYGGAMKSINSALRLDDESSFIWAVKHHIHRLRGEEEMLEECKKNVERYKDNSRRIL